MSRLTLLLSDCNCLSFAYISGTGSVVAYFALATPRANAAKYGNSISYCCSMLGKFPLEM